MDVLSTDIVLAGSGIQCDTNAKKVLANKAVLSRIMKSAMAELSEMSYSEIESCIEDISITEIPVNPGLTNDPEKAHSSPCVEGIGVESGVHKEGIIYYDIRFNVYLPNNSGSTKIILNVEAQKNPTGYDIVSRGVFYASRMISSQLGMEFSNNGNDKKQYDNMKKVYSIWVCMNPRKCEAGSIIRYEFKPEKLFAITDSEALYHHRYDLASMVFFNLSEEDTGNETLDMLSVLFDPNTKADEKIRILRERFGLPISDLFEREVRDMCDYSSFCMEKGIVKGSLTATIATCKSLKVSFKETVAQVIAQCNLSREDAEREVSKRWNENAGYSEE